MVGAGMWGRFGLSSMELGAEGDGDGAESVRTAWPPISYPGLWQMQRSTDKGTIDDHQRTRYR